MSEYYKHHKERVVYFTYGVDGNKRNASSKLTYADQFMKILNKNGWKVRRNPRKGESTHMYRYLLWGKVLTSEDPKLPHVSINLDNCKEAMISMSNAPVKEDNDGSLHKVKSSERNANIPQEEATHLSDCADMLLMSVSEIDSFGGVFIPNIHS